MSNYLIQGVKIARADIGLSEVSDILVSEGKIEKIARSLEFVEGVKVIDGKDCVLLPALFDAHTHFRQPGEIHKETIQSGANAALRGGITGAVMMPNTNPAIDSPDLVKEVLAEGKKTGIEVLSSACVTQGRKGDQLSDFAELQKSGVLMLTDDGSPVANAEVMRKAMKKARDLEMLIACHCETPELSKGGAIHLGKMSQHLGIKGIPACSEEIGIFRDIALAFEEKARVHIQHISTALGMEIVRFWKEKGAKVSAEVSPHHLIFCEEDIQQNQQKKEIPLSFYKMNPPLRTQKDKEALLQGLKEGVFDFIATDHAPHSLEEKKTDIYSAPFGIIGLETALVSLYHFFISQRHFDWSFLVRKFSDEPRTFMNLNKIQIVEGEKANFVLFSPQKETIFNESEIQSLSKNTPFLNQKLKGRVEAVFHHKEARFYSSF